jgi:DNA-binding CsgD family transcriptional regulator/pimeloyl-ACP methyl ester carboxylesterase
MMPRVRFVRAGDGTNIAYSTLGEGPPLALMPAILFSHLEKLWELPQLRRGLEQLAENWTVVRYDNRGCGLSERDATDFSLEAHLSDLGAVVDALALERFALNAPMVAGPVGIAYAARNPDRTSHLILQSTIARASDVWSVPAQALVGLMERDWDLFTETAARFVFQWAEEGLARQAAPILRECVTPQTAQALLKAALEFDVTALLPQVKAPTLVIHNRQFPLDMVLARDLASRIPDARLAAVDSLDSVVPAVTEFLRQNAKQTPGRPRGASEPPPELPSTPSFDPARLSKREIEILRLVAAGKSNRRIAEELTISTNTVDRHVSHILGKIGAANRAEAAAYAARQRLLA